MSILSDKLEIIPHSPGVYLYKDKTDKVIYVGKAKILRNRVRSYFQTIENLDEKTQKLRRKISDVEFFITDTEREALLLENNLIKKYNPHYNIRLKDDKTYPYIQISNEDFPQVRVTRKIVRDGSKYFGPYTNAYDIRRALKTIQKFFQIRTCDFKMTNESIDSGKHSLCFDYQIKRCGGPCEKKQSYDEYNAMIQNVDRFLTGKAISLKQHLTAQMQDYSKQLRFEDAGKFRDLIEALDLFFNKHQKVEKISGVSQDFIGIAIDDIDVCVMVMKVREGKLLGKQHVNMRNEAFDDEQTIFEHFIQAFYKAEQFLPDEIYIADEYTTDAEMHQEFLCDLTESNVKLIATKIGDKRKLVNLAKINAKQILAEENLKRFKKDFTPKAVNSLQRDLRLKTPPVRIECFDNSHIQGTDTVSSLVVFIDGKPAKSQYRKFIIKTLKEGQVDDFAAMYEVISRRYGRLKRENKPFPDLIVVDGGKGQLSVAIKALKDIGVWPKPIVSLAKRLEEVFIPEVSEAQNIPKTSSSNRLLQQLRDESHRFAITFHRQKRAKRTLKSELNDIDGIGEKRRVQLLTYFGSLKRIKIASLKEIKKVPSFPELLAEKLYNHFHS